MFCWLTRKVAVLVPAPPYPIKDAVIGISGTEYIKALASVCKNFWGAVPVGLYPVSIKAEIPSPFHPVIVFQVGGVAPDAVP